MLGRLGIGAVRPVGNTELKDNLLALINQGNAAEIKANLEELEAQDEQDLLTTEKDELIIAAQNKNAHAIVIFLKNHFKMTIYLGVPPKPFGEDKNTLIGQEPLNTTGDFYHLLAYVALSKSLGYDIPKLVFTYEDTNDKATKLPYSRDIALLNTLGLGNLIKVDIQAEIARLGRSSSNTRRLALRELIDTGSYHLIDQKATTAILADQCALFGLKQVSAMIRPILSKLPEAFSNEVKRYIYQFGAAELNAVKESTKPYVVMHLRFAGMNKPGYNAQQDLSPSFIVGVANHLREKGYEVLFIHSTSRTAINSVYRLREIQGDARAEERTALNPFLPREKLKRSKFGDDALPDYLSDLVEPRDVPVSQQTVDVGKVLHLQFFLKLYKLSERLQRSNRAIKVLANTSGTTDAIAFIGHNVLNIHHFNSVNIGQSDYQNYRILMQLAFMNVVKDTLQRNVQGDIEQWLEGKRIRPDVAFNTTIITNLIQGSNRKFLMDFAVLCCVLGKPDGRPGNTGTNDGTSAELLTSAKQAFQNVKSRFNEPTMATNSVTTFRPLSSEVEEDVLANTFNARINLSST